MAHDIKTNVVHVGSKKTEFEALLGKPDRIQNNLYEYSLGMCSGLRIDFDTLDIHLNSDDRVTKVQIVQH